jgi:hypothetical protein
MDRNAFVVEAGGQLLGRYRPEAPWRLERDVGQGVAGWAN